MESVFRFALVRPGFGEEGEGRVELARESPLQVSLVQARGGANARAEMIAIATKYVATPGIARKYTDYGFGPAWQALAEFIADKPHPNLDKVTKKVKELFGAEPDKVINDQKFIADDVRAADGIVVVRMLKPEHRAGHGVLPTVARLAELIRVIARKDSTAERLAAKGPERALGWVLVVPPKIFPLPNPERAAPPAPPVDPKIKEIGELKKRIEATKSALDELMDVEST